MTYTSEDHVQLATDLGLHLCGFCFAVTEVEDHTAECIAHREAERIEADRQRVAKWIADNPPCDTCGFGIEERQGDCPDC
jgi:hypothetical protein